jgi:phage terminase large subunit
LRKPGSELWFSMNPEEERDPIIARLWNDDRESILVDLKPGREDNPWWTQELQIEMDADFARDPDLAEHVWNGAPRAQGSKSIMSRKAIRAAMDRDLPLDPAAIVEIGVDVARFGDDKTVICKRQGMKIISFEKLSGADTQEVARRTWDIAGRDPKVAIKVDDDGVGGGVTDKLNDLGAWVIPIHNGSPAWDDVRFTTCADEQWFGLPIDEIDIPDDDDLMAELSGRQYAYTRQDQRKIESKADFKKRYGHSPDSADALLLTFYQAKEGRVPGEYGAGDLGL